MLPHSKSKSKRKQAALVAAAPSALTSIPPAPAFKPPPALMPTSPTPGAVETPEPETIEKIAVPVPAPRTTAVGGGRQSQSAVEDPPAGQPDTPPPKKKKKRGLNILLSGSPHISVQERINFARHLSVTIQSGLPLIEGLRLIQAQLPSKGVRKIVASVIESVNNGQTLAQALGHYQRSFGEFFISMVQVGEASGNLSQNLLHLSKELKKQSEIRARVKSAMIYPAVVLVATVGMSIGLTVFIFPKILPIFTSLRVDLPFTTRLIIAFMEFIQTKGVATGIGLAVGVGILRGLITVKGVHYWFDRLLLMVPVVSRIVVNLTLANFTRSLSILLRSGMTLVDSLSVTQVTFHNLYYQRQVRDLIEAVRRGEEMANHLAKQPKFFPPMLTGMIKVGENTGNLEENLRYLSDFFSEEVETSVRNLTSLLEPILVLVMGLVVGFIALSIIMPIYSITQGLQVK